MFDMWKMVFTIKDTGDTKQGKWKGEDQDISHFGVWFMNRCT
jgi:hypothetical protein